MSESEWSDEFGAHGYVPRGTVGPWPRFWAKLVDVSLWSFPLGFLVGYLFPEFAIQPVFQGVGGSALFGALLLPFSLAVDAIVLAVFGNTPGRALAGICVQTIRHEQLDLKTALKRNARIYLHGMAMGVPIIVLLTYSHNFSKVNGGQQTSWDEDLFTRVYNEKNSLFRTLIASAVALSLLIADRAIAILEEQSSRANLDSIATDNGSSIAGSSDPIADELQMAAADIKPQMVDEITRLDGAEAYGRTFTFKYTVLRRDANDEEFAQFFKNMIIPKVCSDDYMKNMMKNYEVKYQFNYTMPNADGPLINDVSWSDCK